MRGEISENKQPPQGNSFLINRPNNQFVGVSSEGVANNIVLEDDNFFHVTCHVDKSLTEKIERGEFVELEKLLIKDKFRKRGGEEHQRLEFVNHDGHTFLAPISDKDSKIGGVRKWEQAFRVYAAIYSKANPHRVAEIWQYVHVINTAASCYIWDNVSYYDYTFRQMMSLNPNRSWAKTYNQLWNLAMTTPIQRTGFHNTGGQGHGGHSNHGVHGSNHQGNKGHGGNNKGKRNGLRPCWKFNKNQACELGCRFDHKCSIAGIADIVFWIVQNSIQKMINECVIINVISLV